MDETVPPDRDPVTLTEGEGETLDMPEGLGSIASGQVFEMAGRGAGIVKRIRNSEFGTRRRLRKRIKPHPKEEAMSRPQVTVRRVGRRPTAIRNSTRPPGTTRSFRHPERGRPTAESKDPPTSPESVPELGSLSSFGGSLDSQSSLGMTGIRMLSLTREPPKGTCLPNRSDLRP